MDMKKTYISPKVKMMTMTAKDSFALVLSSLDGVTDNPSIPEIGYGGGNSEGPTPSVNRSVWGEEEY